MLTPLRTWFVLYCGLLLWLSPGATASANSSRLVGEETSGQMRAPNLEDHAAYFSTGKVGGEVEQKKAHDLRKLTIDSIHSLLKTSKVKGHKRFELYLRLGELYVENHDYLRGIELETYQSAYDRWIERDGKGKEPMPSHKTSKANLTKAVNIFRKLAHEFPKHPRADSAIYELAKTMARLGNRNAVRYFNQLIREHHKSKLLPDAHLALAEFYFDRQEVSKAITSYKNAMKFKDHKAYPYAVYKLGWAYYNANPKNKKDELANLQKSIAAFKLVVKLSERDGKKKIGLRDEAIKDLVMVWAEAEDVESAWAYFETIGEKKSFYSMLERLGWIYTEQGKLDRAISVYERLITEAPLRPKNPVIFTKLLALYDKKGQHRKVFGKLKDMHVVYVSTDEWRGANKAHADHIQETDERVERQIYRYGAMYHNRGQKTNQKKILKSATDIYKLYLTHYPKGKHAYSAQFYLAEILFTFKKYQEAAGHYIKVARAQPKEGKFLREAALNAVVAMNKAVTSQEFAKVPPSGQVAEPIAIPALKLGLVQAIDQFIELLPKDEINHPMRYSAAEVYFDYGHYPEALKRFEAIIDQIPKSQQAQSAVQKILSYHSQKEDWESVVAIARKILSSEEVATEKLKKTVVQTLRHAIFQRALAFETKKQYVRAAKAFVKYHKEFPNDKNADKALYNGMLNYFRATKVGDALTAGAFFLESFPKSKIRREVIVRLAETHETMGQFEQAAKYYSQFANYYPSDKRALAALYNAAVIHFGLSRWTEARKNFIDFRQRYPKDSRSTEALYQIALIHEKLGDYEKAIKAMRGYARRIIRENPDRAYEATARAVSISTRHVDRVRGTKELNGLADALKKDTKTVAYEARRLVAREQFRLLDQKFVEFKEIAIGDGKAIEERIKAKQQRLESLARAYEQIIEIRSPEYIVASLYRLGELHENFSETLFQAKSPVGASQAKVDEFRTSIENLAFPLRDEAKKFFEAALGKSGEVETFSAWTIRAYKRMVDLEPAKHPRMPEQSLDSGYLTHALDRTHETAALVE